MTPPAIAYVCSLVHGIAIGTLVLQVGQLAISLLNGDFAEAYSWALWALGGAVCCWIMSKVTKLAEGSDEP